MYHFRCDILNRCCFCRHTNHGLCEMPLFPQRSRFSAGLEALFHHATFHLHLTTFRTFPPRLLLLLLPSFPLLSLGPWCMYGCGLCVLFSLYWLPFIVSLEVARVHWMNSFLFMLSPFSEAVVSLVIRWLYISHKNNTRENWVDVFFLFSLSYFYSYVYHFSEDACVFLCIILLILFWLGWSLRCLLRKNLTECTWKNLIHSNWKNFTRNKHHLEELTVSHSTTWKNLTLFTWKNLTDCTWKNWRLTPPPLGRTWHIPQLEFEEQTSTTGKILIAPRGRNQSNSSLPRLRNYIYIKVSLHSRQTWKNLESPHHTTHHSEYSNLTNPRHLTHS